MSPYFLINALWSTLANSSSDIELKFVAHWSREPSCSISFSMSMSFCTSLRKSAFAFSSESYSLSKSLNCVSMSSISQSIGCSNGLSLSGSVIRCPAGSVAGSVRAVVLISLPSLSKSIGLITSSYSSFPNQFSRPPYTWSNSALISSAVCPSHVGSTLSLAEPVNSIGSASAPCSTKFKSSGGSGV